MKVCIIAGHYANSSDGIGRYTKNLVSHLKKLDNSLQIEIVGFHSNKTKAIQSSPKSSFIPKQFDPLLMPIRRELGYYERFKNNNEALLKNLEHIDADIYHAISPSESIAPIKLHKKPLITTIHDVIPLLGNNRYFFEKRYFDLYCKYAVQSDAIIVDSKSTKQDVKNYFDVQSDKLHVIYPGFDGRQFFPDKNKKQKELKHILYLGGLVKRKGIYETIHAFHKLLSLRKDIKLQIGGQGDELTYIKKLTQDLNITKHIEFLGFIDDTKLVKIYQYADLFVYPSKYEGFGLTPLEAMASGVPVITSSTSSLPEVVCKAGQTVDPTNIEELAKQMKQILDDDKLQTNMISEGLKQAKKFTWEQCAKETLQLYEQFL